MKHSTSKNPVKLLKKKEQIKTAYREYAESARFFLEKAKVSKKKLLDGGVETVFLKKVHYFIAHAEKQIDLITRRVIQGEKIPHEEKVFLFSNPIQNGFAKEKQEYLLS